MLGFHVASQQDARFQYSVLSPFFYEDLVLMDAVAPKVTSDVYFDPSPMLNPPSWPIQVEEDFGEKFGMRIHAKINKFGTWTPRTKLVPTVVQQGIPGHPPPHPVS